MLNILLQIIIFRLEAALATTVKRHPACDNERRHGDGDDEEDPERA